MTTPMVSTFTLVGHAQDFSPESWQDSFTANATSKWEHDAGGSISAGQYSLVIEYLGDGFVSVAYNQRNKTFYFIHGQRAEGFEVSTAGATVPAASRVELADAWLPVRAFLKDPTIKPDGVWIDADDLHWVEDF